MNSHSNLNFVSVIVAALLCPLAMANDDKVAEDMASFEELVERVLVEKVHSEAPADARLHGDTVPTQTVSDAALPDGARHQRHLGVGFAHGKSNLNGNARGTDKSGPNTFPLNDPPTDVCQGSGHDAIASAFDNGIGRTDCGDPSPSD